MPHVLVVCLVPLMPLSCLGLLLWLDRLEETLDRDVRRRRDRVSQQEAQLAASVAAASAASAPDRSPGNRSPGGSTNR